MLLDWAEHHSTLRLLRKQEKTPGGSGPSRRAGSLMSYGLRGFQSREVGRTNQWLLSASAFARGPPGVACPGGLVERLGVVGRLNCTACRWERTADEIDSRRMLMS